MSEVAASGVAQAVEGEDHTVDPATVQPGQFVFQYGYIPCVVFGVVDGQIEVGRFASFDYGDPTEFSTHRGPLPGTSLPEQTSPNDRVTELENQMAALLAIIKDQGLSAPTEVPAAPTPEAPTAVSSPFGQVAAGTPTEGWNTADQAAAPDTAPAEEQPPQ